MPPATLRDHPSTGTHPRTPGGLGAGRPTYVPELTAPPRGVGDAAPLQMLTASFPVTRRGWIYPSRAVFG